MQTSISAPDGTQYPTQHRGTASHFRGVAVAVRVGTLFLLEVITQPLHLGSGLTPSG